MKKNQRSNYWNLGRDFFVRLGILVVRTYVLAIGWFALALGLIDVAQGHFEYLGNIVLALILIFPFRLLKKPRNFHLYFGLLTINSFLLLFQERFQGVPWWWESVERGSYVINILAVWQYWRHYLDPKRFNPLFPVRKLAYALFTIILLVSGLLTYLFFDVHETNNGTSYFNLNGLSFMIPMPMGYKTNHWAEPIYTKEAFTDSYKIRSSVASQNDSLNVALIVPIEKEGSVALYEDKKKIMQIEYGTNGIGHVVTYDAVTPEGQGSVVGTQPWRRDTNGKFHPDTRENLYRLEGNYDIWIGLDYRSHMNEKSGGFSSLKYSSGDALQITINKSIDYPQRVGWKFMPFERKKLPWNLAVKQEDKTVAVVNGIEVWYK